MNDFKVLLKQWKIYNIIINRFIKNSKFVLGTVLPKTKEGYEQSLVTAIYYIEDKNEKNFDRTKIYGKTLKIKSIRISF